MQQLEIKGLSLLVLAAPVISTHRNEPSRNGSSKGRLPFGVDF